MHLEERIRTLAARIFAVGVAAAAALLATPAGAQSVTFANFTQVDPASQSFVGTNNTTSFSISTVAAPVTFTFSSSAIPGLPAALVGPLAATETITGSATTAVATVDGNNQITQAFNATETIRFVLNTPIMGLSNLLTVTFSTASSSGLSGASGATAAGLNGSTAAGDSVAFSSSFLNFSNTTTRGLSIALTSINPVLTIGPGGFVNSFTASQSGNFSSTPPPFVAVPTPASGLLLGLGLLGISAAALGRRRPAILALG